MTTIRQQIASLEARRADLRASIVGRWASEQERAQIADLTAQLAQAWEQRRREIARGPERDHEIRIVRKLKERSA